MTDLTELWKKGELPDGWYWVKLIPDFEDSDDIAFYTGGYFELYSDEDIEQVLAPVPTFDEWQALIDLYKEADVIIKKSDKENIKIKSDCKTLARKLPQVKPELREWLEVNYGEYL